MGERITLLREAYNLTKAEFAEKAGVSALTIGNIERAVTQSLQPDSLKEIVDVFGTTRSWLEDGEGKMLPAGKKDLNYKSAQHQEETPWKNEAFLILKQENQRLWEMIDDFRRGRINFLLPLKETA